MKLETISNLLKGITRLLNIMNINTVGHAQKFRDSVIAQVYEKGVGPIITEHLPDDMHHGHHKKAIIYKIKKGIVIAFQNMISDENWKNLNTKNCLNKLHERADTIDTHGEGLQNLFSIAKTIILFNHDTNESKITIKELEYGKFFKALKTCKNNDSSKLAAKFTKETIYDLKDEDEDVDDGLEKFKHTEVYKEFESTRGKFIKDFKFGYFINFEMSKKAIDYDEQQIFLNKLHQFVKDECPEIRIKNSQSSYEIYTIKESDKPEDDNNELTLKLLEKDDPIKFNYRKIHLECQVRFLNDENTKRAKKRHEKFIAYFPKLNENLLFTRNLTHGAWEGVEGKQVKDCPQYFDKNGEFKWDIKLDLFQIDEQFYTQRDAEKFGWIILQTQNKEKILVNLQPISIDFVGKHYTSWNGKFRKSLRIVTTIKDMKFSKSDGLKPYSTWKKKSPPVESIIKCIFKDVYEKSREFDFYHKRTQFAPVNISYSLNIFKNIVRPSQSKKSTPKKKVEKNKVKQENFFKKTPTTPPNSPDVSLKIVNKEVKKEIKKEVNKKIITTKQQKRHSKPGGYLYLFQHTNWKEKGIAKFGVAKDWEKRMKQHQTHYPLHRIVLEKLLRIPHNVEDLETIILAECQKQNCQFNTHATTKSEFVILGPSLDNIITENLPNNNEEMDIKLWNNVIVSDEENELRLN